MLTHRLFFALRPDASVREGLQHAIAKLTAAGIRSRWPAGEKLHLTLQFLGDFAAIEEIVPGATGAAESLRVAPFEFALDRAETFPRRFNPPCVLGCAEGSAAPLRALSRELGDALGAAGLAEHLDKRPYVPHVTIAYVETELREPVAITPIIWLAREFALIDSVAGIHTEIARWPLRA